MQTHRVELNAMTTPQLIEWLDAKMEEYGDGKLIPPDEVLVDELMVETEQRLRAQITARILREAGLDGTVAAAMAALDPPDGEALRRKIEMFEDEPEADVARHHRDGRRRSDAHLTFIFRLSFTKPNRPPRNETSSRSGRWRAGSSWRLARSDGSTPACFLSLPV